MGIKFEPPRDIPDLSGKVILVTGGNTGLGKESVLQLAKHNPSRLYLGARSPSKAEDAIREIKTAVPKANITFLPLDLTSCASVRAAANAFLDSSERLDVLMNNAGIMANPEGLTEDGYELQFGTNHMGHALLTKLLLPVLEQTARKAGADVRVVTLSSMAADRLGPKEGIVFPTLKTNMADYGTFSRYGQSKVANVLFAAELARRHPSITSVSCHPGAIKTQLATPFQETGLKGRAFGWASTAIGTTLSKGAKNQLWCATGNGVESGRFYFPVGKDHVGRGYAEDKALGRKLWDWTENEFTKKGYA